MTETLHIDSISQMHKLLNLGEVVHPHIYVFRSSGIKPEVMESVLVQRISTSLFSINLKTGRECKLIYGRMPYDFKEGTLLCIAPNQIVSPIPQEISEIKSTEKESIEGWNILFHPNLLRNHPLSQKMSQYRFFRYKTHEALFLLPEERETLDFLVRAIEKEYSQTQDNRGNDIILNHLESILNYCLRFYERQFACRAKESHEILIRLDNLLSEYFSSNLASKKGLPRVQYCAENLGYSSHYLSDLLKKETGENTQEHIHNYLMEKARSLLIGTDETIQGIALQLGFEYPQHFSALFKKKCGISPSAYRQKTF